MVVIKTDLAPIRNQANCETIFHLSHWLENKLHFCKQPKQNNYSHSEILNVLEKQR